jgi:hypothetical protein
MTLFGDFVLVTRMNEEIHILDGTTNTSNHKQRFRCDDDDSFGRELDAPS